MVNEFAGFPPPIKNFFSLPNEMINIVAQITNMAELKVIIYIMRHTWGFHEYGICKAISTDEFMHGRRRADGSRMDEGTGMSNRSVIDGLRAAIEHGYLICQVEIVDQARIIKSYALKMITPCEESSQGVGIAEGDASSQHEESSPLPYEESSQAPMKNLHTPYEESSHRSEKDTKKYTRKTKEKDIGDDVAIATATPPLSDELADVVRQLQQAGYAINFTGALPGDHLLFEVRSPDEPEWKNHFDTAEDIVQLADDARVDELERQDAIVRRRRDRRDNPIETMLEPVSPLVAPATRIRPARPRRTDHERSNDTGDHRAPGNEHDTAAADSLPARGNAQGKPAPPHPTVRPPDDGAARTRPQANSEVAPTTRKRAAKVATVAADPLDGVSPEVAAIVAEWLAIFTDDRKATATMVKHATELAGWHPAPGEIALCRLWMYQADKKKHWYTDHGMHLGDVVREFERWRSLASVPIPTFGKTVQSISSFDDPNYDMSGEFYPSDAEKAQRRQQQYVQC
jgi:hypothetical protein